jgi:hypothetical protein
VFDKLVLLHELLWYVAWRVTTTAVICGKSKRMRGSDHNFLYCYAVIHHLKKIQSKSFVGAEAYKMSCVCRLELDSVHFSCFTYS